MLTLEGKSALPSHPQPPHPPIRLGAGGFVGYHGGRMAEKTGFQCCYSVRIFLPCKHSCDHFILY